MFGILFKTKRQRRNAVIAALLSVLVLVGIVVVASIMQANDPCGGSKQYTDSCFKYQKQQGIGRYDSGAKS